MTAFKRLLLALVLLGASAAAQDEAETKKPDPDLRTFTGKNGKKIEAKVLNRIDDERYQVETADGKSLTINITNLVAADQAFLDAWEPDAILDIATAPLDKVLAKMGYSSSELTAAGSRSLVTAEVDGKTMKFVIDPGRAYSMLTPKAAETLGLKLSPGNMQFRSPDGKTERANQGTVEAFAIGEVELKKETFIVYDLSKVLSNAPGAANGLLGGPALEKLNAIVDYGGRRFFAREAKPE